ncbi:DUF2478 domain-containing protein [Donghicola mangrovi]|nr:DUF2478 domain-containing protein [Donghicola mangrovi]
MSRLGYILSLERGSTDPLLSGLAARLTAEGRVVAGIVQSRAPKGKDHPCDMDLAVLPQGPEIAIAQKLGTGSRGCRLDPASLEDAAAWVMRALETGADALIVNKFGAQECQGRGLCEAFGLAMERGVPVLTAVNRLNHEGFLSWAGGMATQLEPDDKMLHGWLTERVPA